MQHAIRPVRADEWRKVKELRLAALADPAAPLAFLDTWETASAQPDSFWQERAAGAAQGDSVRQFVAEGPDGAWAGTVAVLVEAGGADDIFGTRVDTSQGHLVGVFVRPECRGTGLTELLVAGALEWAWSLEEPRLNRVRLFVHEDNARAQGFYRKAGFVATGVTALLTGDGRHDLEMEIGRP
ncbi:GNAT family N-acetyltransferase [Streptomyces sp. ASQP_92]|uniref:GNAT family N-acetyltransferase n=1 Tax=Streptomyces sp. ASQP_92 TaxID=2979116 RepID=UPI0021BE4887|nr:GNAT family N-acetyltransferase [Streptomyces sp. ASQP_92]MCT9091121.1 GNAT family N-acetyltransferase [Streptomyces sp. ASQP_92]